MLYVAGFRVGSEVIHSTGAAPQDLDGVSWSDQTVLMAPSREYTERTMSRDMLDRVIDGVNANMPQVNRYTFKGYRQDKIAQIPEYLDMAFTEATKRYGLTERGEPEVKYLGHRFLTPEECLAMDAANPRFSSYVDVLRTETVTTEFMFEHRGIRFATQLNIPYLCEDAIIIGGSRYYVMFALTDKVFYHIVKSQGIGIKILCAHLRFWRNMRYNFRSTTGNVYGDHVVITKIHLRNYKSTADDIETALILYPLVKFGLKETLRRYDIDPEHIKVVLNHDDKDPDYEYFEIRPETDQDGLYLRVHKDILATQFDTKNRIKMQVVVALHYILKYFVKCKITIYKNNRALVGLLNDDPTFTIYKVILGKTIFGINYDSEIQVAGHMRDHLESLEIYMDPETQRKLRTIGVDCNDVYDLIHYVSLHMDEYVANYFPSNVYNKQMNVLDLLLGHLVNSLFTKIYKQTNNRKGDRPYDTQKVMSSFRVGRGILNRVYLCGALIASNPAQYNDDGLMTVFGRRKRATFATIKAGSNGTGKGKNDQKLMQDPEHRTHSSLFIVESGSRTQTTDPTKSGTLSMSCIVTPDGDIVVPDWLKAEAATVDKYIHSK